MENRLLRLDLSGFKSIRQASIDIADVNVLIGANGSGKSNLITFFRLLDALRSMRLQGFVADEGGANSLLHFGAKRTREIEARLSFEGVTGSNRYHFRIAFGAGDRLVFLDEDIQYCKRGGSWQTAPTYPLGSGHLESQLGDAKTDMQGRPLPEKTPGVMRHLMRDWRVFQFHDTSKTARLKQSVYADNKDYLWSDGGNLAAFLLYLRDVAPSNYAEIVETVRRVLPAFGDFALSAHPTSRHVMLNWSHRGSDEVFGPHQLSDGSLRFMAVAALLLQPKPPSLMLIDEPELGLHPYAIELLAALLRSASKLAQVLISTQSAALANQFEPRDIVVVDVENDASRFTRLDTERWKDWLLDYGVGDLWAKNLLGGVPA